MLTRSKVRVHPVLSQMLLLFRSPDTYFSYTAVAVSLQTSQQIYILTTTVSLQMLGYSPASSQDSHLQLSCPNTKDWSLVTGNIKQKGNVHLPGSDWNNIINDLEMQHWDVVTLSVATLISSYLPSVEINRFFQLCLHFAPQEDLESS